jgi:DNA-binding transcriptional regulator GbsR (MarR family)
LQDPLDEVKTNTISAWERMAVSRGTNPLVGRILGVLYTSSEPLSQKEISGKVGYELSAVSQTLNLLSGLGAIRRIKKRGERTGYYEPNAPVSTMLANTLARWLDGEKAFHTTIKQQLARLREIQAKTSRKEEARRLLQVLGQIDLALQRFVEILDEAVTKMQKVG